MQNSESVRLDIKQTLPCQRPIAYSVCNVQLSWSLSREFTACEWTCWWCFCHASCTLYPGATPCLNQTKYFQWVRTHLTLMFSCWVLHVWKSNWFSKHCLEFIWENGLRVRVHIRVWIHLKHKTLKFLTMLRTCSVSPRLTSCVGLGAVVHL